MLIMGQYVPVLITEEQMIEKFNNDYVLIDTNTFIYAPRNGISWNISAKTYKMRSVNYNSVRANIYVFVLVDGVIRAVNALQTSGSSDQALINFSRSFFFFFYPNAYRDPSNCGFIMEILYSIRQPSEYTIGNYKIACVFSKNAMSNTITATTTVTNIQNNTTVKTYTCNENIKWYGLENMENKSWYCADDLFSYPFIPECFYGPNGYQTILLKYGFSMNRVFATFPHVWYKNFEVFRFSIFGRANEIFMPSDMYGTIDNKTDSDTEFTYLNPYYRNFNHIAIWYDTCMTNIQSSDDAICNNNPNNYMSKYPRDDNTINIVVGSELCLQSTICIVTEAFKYNNSPHYHVIEPKLFTLTRNEINNGKTLLSFYNEIMNYIYNEAVPISEMFFAIVKKRLNHNNGTVNEQFISTSEQQQRRFYLKQTITIPDVAENGKGNVVNYVTEVIF